jgi:hypothetical protein
MSGTYQSRVFTFISKRTNRLKDTCAQGFRQIRVAVVWSSQILLYPIQLLAQKTKIFQPQISPPPQQRSFAQPVSDINIEQALDLVVKAGYPIAIAERGSVTVVDASSQSLSRRVSTGKIAMVGNDNSSNIGQYDPDTDDWEITSYRPRRSLPVVARKPTIRGISSLLIDRQLVLVTTTNELLDILTLSQQQEIRRQIGIDLAMSWHQWHTGRLVDPHRDRNLSANQQLLLTDEDAIQQLAIAGSKQDSLFPNLLERWNNWLQTFHTESPSETSIMLSETTAKIEPKRPHQLPSADYSFTPQPPIRNRYLELPQLPPIVENLETPIPDRLLADKISQFQPNWLKQWLNYYRDYLYIPAAQDLQIVHQPVALQIIPIESKPEKARSKQHDNRQNSTIIISGNPKIGRINSANDLTLNNSATILDSDLEYYQDWIDTDSELIGYNQSPGAKFLAWLDRIILQIENWLIKIWNQIFSRKNSI